jgi:hypothetical protein
VPNSARGFSFSLPLSIANQSKTFTGRYYQATSSFMEETSTVEVATQQLAAKTAEQPKPKPKPPPPPRPPRPPAPLPGP